MNSSMRVGGFTCLLLLILATTFFLQSEEVSAPEAKAVNNTKITNRGLQSDYQTIVDIHYELQLWEEVVKQSEREDLSTDFQEFLDVLLRNEKKLADQIEELADHLELRLPNSLSRQVSVQRSIQSRESVVAYELAFHEQTLDHLSELRKHAYYLLSDAKSSYLYELGKDLDRLQADYRIRLRQIERQIRRKRQV